MMFSRLYNSAPHGEDSDGPLSTSPSDLPAGPDVSIEDQARLWLETPCDLLESCQRRFGDLFTLRLGRFGTIVIVAGGEAVRQLFTLSPEAYECGPFNESYRYVMGDNALFLQDGPDHLRLKGLLASALRSSWSPAHAGALCEVVRSTIAARGTGSELRLRPLLHEVALQSLLLLVFGDRAEARATVISWFRTSVWQDLRSWKAWTRLSRLHPQLRDLLSAELAWRRGNAPAGRKADLLDHLLAARDQDGQPLSDAVIQDQVLMLTITAGDAVAVASSWALYRMARHPQVQERLFHAYQSLGPDPAPQVAAALPYLKATCQEVLRLHTVLPTVSGRRLTSALDFMGYALPAGITLTPCEHLAHRRAEVFDDPLAFRTERFLTQTWAAQEYFPFGGGARACLGAALAPLTVRLVLMTILSEHRVALSDPAPPVPVEPRVVRYGTLLAPHSDLTLHLLPR